MNPLPLDSSIFKSTAIRREKVLVRNVAVVVIILGYPKAADESSMLQGFFWGVVPTFCTL